MVSVSSPKFQAYASPLELLFVNKASKGAHPPLAEANVISATGCGFTCTMAEAVPKHPSAVCPSKETKAESNSSELLAQVWVGLISLEDVPSPKFQVMSCAPSMVRASAKRPSPNTFRVRA